MHKRQHIRRKNWWVFVDMEPVDNMAETDGERYRLTERCKSLREKNLLM